MSLFSFSNDKPKRQFLNIKSTKIPKSSQDTLAFIEAYENGIFRTAENTYSLIFKIDNIDYRLLRDPEQNNIYRFYQQYLNALPSEVCYQEFLMNIPKILELYVTGSFNNFAGHTNIESTSNRIIIDISDMGQQLRTVGLQVIFEYLWQRVRQNHQRGIRTVIINDEISSMFLDGNYYANIDSSGQFYQKIFKRIRKYGGYVTGITQNISQVLDSPQARTMLSNASFIVLLQQAEDDLERIKKLFNLSPTHLSYISSGKVGTGIIICGKKIIPFSKALPPEIIKTNALYKLCSTKFKE